MVGWHHQFNGYELEQTPRESEGQESLVCCSPGGQGESGLTWWPNNNNNSKYKYQGKRERKRSGSAICSTIKPYVHPNISAQTPISNCLLSLSTCMSSLCLICYRSKTELLLFVHTCPSSLFPILVHDSPIFVFDQATNFTHHPSGYSPKSS